MWNKIIVAAVLWGIFSVCLWLARREGKKTAQVETLKQELKKQAEEQEHAKQITDNVYSLSPDDARKRLQAVANNQKRDSMQ